MSRRAAVLAHPEGCIVEVWVVPRAARTEVAGDHDGAVRIRVAAAPEKGKANAAAAEALSAALGGLPVRLERGAASRRKRFVVVGASAAHVRRLLETVAGW